MRDLLRAVAKTAGGSGAALLMGMAAAKILAVLVGPSGLGFYSLLRQTQQTAVLLAVFNGQTALVQGIASRKTEDERRRYISVVFWIVMAVTIVVALMFILAPNAVARSLTGPGHYDAAEIMRFLALSIVFGAISNFIVGVLNGHRLIGRASLVLFANHFVVAVLAYPAGMLVRGGATTAYAWLLNAGALGAAGLGIVLLGHARLIHLRRPRWGEEERTAARHFVTISASMIVSAAVAYGVPLFLRAMIVRGFGFTGAGIFDVAWTLSLSYVLIIVTAFSAYYLPTLSAIDDPSERLVTIRRVLRLTIMLMVPLVTAVIVLKPLAVLILYTSDFMPSLRMMRWMLIGDYFKILSWVFSFTMVAYADMKTFLATELIWGGLTLAGSYVAIRRFHSLEQVGVVFMVLSIAYLFVMAWYVLKRHSFSFRQNGAMGALAGLAVVLAGSALTWNDETVRWPIAIACIAAAVLVVSFAPLRNAARAAK